MIWLVQAKEFGVNCLADIRFLYMGPALELGGWSA
jgi:hypothetical protein